VKDIEGVADIAAWSLVEPGPSLFNLERSPARLHFVLSHIYTSLPLSTVFETRYNDCCYCWAQSLHLQSEFNA
jgi:hypothetical protein